MRQSLKITWLKRLNDRGKVNDNIKGQELRQIKIKGNLGKGLVYSKC